jgi:tRNA (guanine37-N1)-methyltransferase
VKPKKIPSSYDIIGSREKAVAIVEIPEGFEEKEIAQEILTRHKNVKSVLKKISERTGIYRTREFKLILGEKNTEVLHKEFGCRFKLDPTKVYFSGREGTERLRIANLVKPKETIMLMFAGIGVYGIIIAKNQPRVKIISIEINSSAFEYMKENIRLNKLGDKIIPVLGDVKEKSKHWYGKCDRIIMPLPHEAENFLPVAYECLKLEGGFIHLYIIEKEEDIKKRTKKIIEKIKKKTKKKVDFKVDKVLPYAPRTNKYCIDIKLF